MDEMMEKEVNRIKNLFLKKNFNDGYQEISNIVGQKFQIVQETMFLRKELIQEKTLRKTVEAENQELKRMFFVLNKKYQNAK